MSFRSHVRNKIELTVQNTIIGNKMKSFEVKPKHMKVRQLVKLQLSLMHPHVTCSL